MVTAVQCWLVKAVELTSINTLTYTAWAFILLNTVILSLVLAIHKLPHCFQPVFNPLASIFLYNWTLDLAKFTCARDGMKTPMNPDRGHVVPPPHLVNNRHTFIKTVLSQRKCDSLNYLHKATVNTSSPTQETPNTLQNWMSSPLVPFIHPINSAHASRPISLKSILKLFFRLCVGLPSGLFSSGFPPKKCILLSPPQYMPQAPSILFSFVW